MQTESIELGFFIYLCIYYFFYFLIINKYSLKIGNGALVDNDFSKPQAFHKEAVSEKRGYSKHYFIIHFFIFYYLLYSEILYSYIFICLSLFLIGYLDDLKN